MRDYHDTVETYKKDIDAVLSNLDWLFDAMTAELALQ